MTVVSFLILGVLVLAIVPIAVKLFSGAGPIRAGHTNLTCPHCNRETPANHPTCQHCQAELR
jgi:hypothetical protein